MLISLFSKLGIKQGAPIPDPAFQSSPHCAVCRLSHAWIPLPRATHPPL